MRTKIQDREVLRSLEQANVSAWLRTREWKLTDADPSRWYRFEKAGFEVDVPASAELIDYARRMAEVLDTLEAAEQLPQLQLVDEIRRARVDVVRLGLRADATHGGRIPVDQGAAFLGFIRDLMLASACATLEKRAAFPRRKANRAMDHIRAIHFGPSEEGSYVATVESPVPPTLGQTLDLFGAAPEAPFSGA